MSNYETWNRVKDIIEKRCIDARNLSEQRCEELRAISPELSEIDRELRGTGMRIFQAMKTPGGVDAVKERNLELNAKRRQVIRSLGYPEDYTDVKYTCSVCNDSGFLENMKMCNCMKKLIVTENIRESGMGRLIEQQSFDNFRLDAYKNDPDTYSAMEYAVRVAKAYAEGFGSKYKGKNLLFIGKTGTGKTHLSTSIAKVVIEQGFAVLYDSAQNIIDAFETDKFKSGYGYSEPVAGKYLECDLLILDDLGTEFATPFAVSCLYNLITTRMNKGLSTLISTNLSAEELTRRYDDRIYSRIVGKDYATVNFKGSDYRLFGGK